MIFPIINNQCRPALLVHAPPNFVGQRQSFPTHLIPESGFIFLDYISQTIGLREPQLHQNFNKKKERKKKKEKEDTLNLCVTLPKKTKTKTKRALANQAAPWSCNANEVLK